MDAADLALLEIRSTDATVLRLVRLVQEQRRHIRRLEEMLVESQLASHRAKEGVYYSQDGARDAASRLSKAEGGRWIVERRNEDMSVTVRSIAFQGKVAWSEVCSVCKGTGGWCGQCWGIGHVEAKT